MASTYSPNLRIELIGTGDQAGTWGSTTNTNLGTLMENAISGYVSVSVISTNQALTALNGAADQSRSAVIELTTTIGAAFAVYAPPSPKTYIVTNSSAYTASFYNSTTLGNTTAAGTGVAVPAGKTMTVWSDGDNMAVQIDHLPTLSLTSDLAVIDGGTGASTATNARTNLGVAIGSDVQAYDADLTALGGLAKTNGNFIVGNGTTWVAESGATARTSLGLGSIATQNSNAVSVTGGSVTGITDITVADGGTGASNEVTAQINLDVPSRSGAGASGTWAINISGNAATSSTSSGNAASATVLQTARTIGGVSFNGSANINLPGVNAAGNQATTGNAATATVFQTTRTINGVSFNGSANIIVEPYVENAVTTSATRYITFVDDSTAGYKRLNEDANLSYNPGTNVLTVPTVSGALSGNATTATTLQTARTIGGVSFNGSANINLPGVNTAGNQNTSGNATTATTATTAVGLAAATWTVSEVGGVLYFKVSGVNKAKLDASGNFTVVGNVTAYGSV